MQGYQLDSDSDVVKEVYAVVFQPRRSQARRERDRFPETCVTVVPSEDEARARARPSANLHAARVVGPARSSEGVRLFYLVAWLD